MSSGGAAQTVTQEVDPDIKNRQMHLYSDAQNYLRANQWQPYQGQMTAGLNPYQMQAQSMLSQYLTG